jgi:hypothetical protein
VSGYRAAFARFDLGRDEPGRDSGTRRDGLPDLLGRAGDFDFDLDRSASGGGPSSRSYYLLGMRSMRQRMGNDHQTMRAATRRRFIVVA